jgi:hypothetical protein
MKPKTNKQNQDHYEKNSKFSCSIKINTEDLDLEVAHASGHLMGSLEY